MVRARIFDSCRSSCKQLPIVDLNIQEVLALAVGRGIYNIFIHPFLRFPGPLSASFSNVRGSHFEKEIVALVNDWHDNTDGIQFLYCYWFLSGNQPLHVLHLHKKYGMTSPKFDLAC